MLCTNGGHTMCCKNGICSNNTYPINAINSEIINPPTTNNKKEKTQCEKEVFQNSRKKIKIFPKRSQSKRFDQDHFGKGKNKKIASN